MDVQLGRPAHVGRQQPRGASAGLGRGMGTRLALPRRRSSRPAACQPRDFLCGIQPAHHRAKRPVLFVSDAGRLPPGAARGASVQHARGPRPEARAEGPRHLCGFSAVKTPYPENNLVNARWFPARGRRAVVLLPHWNADAIAYTGLCRVLNLLGVAVLRLSMPYHDIRMPAETGRADYAVSANIGRTLDAVRQGVVDIRSCLDWLEQQGYRQLGLIGTSLGSCYAFIASAHDSRIRAAAFNHASTYFADVVWHGQSTRHIRRGMEGAIDLERLRRVWLAISPMVYFDKFARFRKRSLVVYADYDLTFLPEFSRQVVREFAAHHLDHKVVVLPCGHYTTGEAPYKYLDGWHLATFFRTAFEA